MGRDLNYVKVSQKSLRAVKRAQRQALRESKLSYDDSSNTLNDQIYFCEDVDVDEDEDLKNLKDDKGI